MKRTLILTALLASMNAVALDLNHIAPSVQMNLEVTPEAAAACSNKHGGLDRKCAINYMAAQAKVRQVLKTIPAADRDAVEGACSTSYNAPADVAACVGLKATYPGGDLPYCLKTWTFHGFNPVKMCMMSY